MHLKVRDLVDPLDVDAVMQRVHEQADGSSCREQLCSTSLLVELSDAASQQRTSKPPGVDMSGCQVGKGEDPRECFVLKKVMEAFGVKEYESFSIGWRLLVPISAPRPPH